MLLILIAVFAVGILLSMSLFEWRSRLMSAGAVENSGAAGLVMASAQLRWSFLGDGSLGRVWR
jgi:hypothetical protein